MNEDKNAEQPKQTEAKQPPNPDLDRIKEGLKEFIKEEAAEKVEAKDLNSVRTASPGFFDVPADVHPANEKCGVSILVEPLPVELPGLPGKYVHAGGNTYRRVDEKAPRSFSKYMPSQDAGRPIGPKPEPRDELVCGLEIPEVEDDEPQRAYSIMDKHNDYLWRRLIKRTVPLGERIRLAIGIWLLKRHIKWFYKPLIGSCKSQYVKGMWKLASDMFD